MGSKAFTGRRAALLASVFALAGVLLLAVLTGAGERPAHAADAEAVATGKRLNRALTQVVRVKNGPPAVAVLIHRDGTNRFFRRGFARVKTRTKPTARLHLRIASVAKAFNGAIVLRLASQGKLRLSDRLGKWVPNLLPKARRATVGQLLHHTAGLPEYIQNERFIALLQANPHRYMTPRQMVGFVRDEKLTHRPGAKYQYSDTDNIVAGIIAEKASGKSYDRLLSEVGRQSGGLPGTSLPRTAKMPRPVFRGYTVVPGGPLEDDTEVMNPALAWASGGIVSTMSDLGKFFRAYVGGRLFGPGVTEAQRRWVRGESGPAGPGVNWAGMSLFRYRTHCGTVYGHTGNFPGYRVFAASTADGRRSVVWVANSQITSATAQLPNAKRISALMRKSQVAAVCHLLG